MNNSRIFVSIASYRDPETPHTLRDLFAKAAHPENIFVGVLWQVVPDLDDDCVDIPEEVPESQIRGINVHPSFSKGACWARSRILTELRRDEEFVLQIDSHMRFVEHWDEKMLSMLQRCTSSRALLSTYPIEYTPPNDLAAPSIPLMTARKFNHRGILMPLARALDYSQRPAQPVSSPFISAGFLFGPVAAFNEVPYDPLLYFIGEEISLAVRLWTHGWDVYNPDDVLLYHFYGLTKERPRHWADNPSWGELDNNSLSRLRHLFGIEVSTNPAVLLDLERYRLGQVRTLDEFERYADVNLRRQTIGAAGWCGRFPSHPTKENDALIRIFEHIYHENVWKSLETRSGMNSTLLATAEMRPALAKALGRLGIRTLVDAGCGDVNWMKLLSHQLDLYLAVDIVQPLAEQNLRLLGQRRGHFFSSANIAQDALPGADAILCRNVLNFLSHETILEVLKNFVASGSRWLIASTQSCLVNQDGDAGIARVLDLTKPPFNLPLAQKLIADGGSCSLGIWPMEAVRRAIEGSSPQTAREVVHMPASGLSHENKTIFIQVACYRDEEILPTVKSAFEQASHPERVTFGICLQIDPERDAHFDSFDYPRRGQVRIVRVHADDALGLGFARSTAQRLWNGEAFALQVDSHMRFAPEWDQKLLSMMEHDGAENSVISALLPGYEVPDYLQNVGQNITRIKVVRMGDEKSPQLVHLGGVLEPRAVGIRQLRRTPFVVGNFVFARAEVFSRIPIDPHLPFFEDEISYSARLWTHGFNVLQPDMVVAYHQWVGRTGRQTVYKSNTQARGERSFVRICHLLGLAHSCDPVAIRELDLYGLGSVRSLASFWDFSGVDITHKEANKFALRGDWGQMTLD